MKYLIPLLFLLTACNKVTYRTYICMSALTPLGGIQIDTSDPGIKETKSHLKLTTDSGNVLIIPKSLCVQVIRAQTN